MKSNGEIVWPGGLASERIRDECSNANRSRFDKSDLRTAGTGIRTSGRRGKVIDLTQLEVYINALAELEYLQSIDASEGGIVRGEEFFFARDLRPSSDSFVPEQEGRGEISQAMVAAVRDAGMRAVNLGCIPTPALACYALARGKGSIMVTGSHIPFDRNGYKLNTSTGELRKTQEAPIHMQVRQVRQRLYSQPSELSPFDERGMFKSGHQDLPAEYRRGPRRLDRAIHQLLRRGIS